MVRVMVRVRVRCKVRIRIRVRVRVRVWWERRRRTNKKYARASRLEVNCKQLSLTATRGEREGGGGERKSGG